MSTQHLSLAEVVRKRTHSRVPGLLRYHDLVVVGAGGGTVEPRIDQATERHTEPFLLELNDSNALP